MTRVCFSLPTRSRPQELIKTIDQNLACMSRQDSLLFVHADADDTATLELISKSYPDDKCDARLKVSVRPREDTVAAKWNRALCVEAEIYVCLGDDDPLVTPGTDEKILEAMSVFPDGVGMVYGHLANLSFSSVICFSKKMTELLGYIQPEHFPYWFCDHWTDDIGRMVGRVAFADVATRQCVQPHQHGTMEFREPEWWATWFDANYMIRRAHANRIIQDIAQWDTPPVPNPWWAGCLAQYAPLIENRSRLLNKIGPKQMRSTLSTKDERYQRTKQKAIDALPQILSTLPVAEAEMYRKELIVPTTIMNLGA